MSAWRIGHSWQVSEPRFIPSNKLRNWSPTSRHFRVFRETCVLKYEYKIALGRDGKGKCLYRRPRLCPHLEFFFSHLLSCVTQIEGRQLLVERANPRISPRSIALHLRTGAGQRPCIFSYIMTSRLHENRHEEKEMPKVLQKDHKN